MLDIEIIITFPVRNNYFLGSSEDRNSNYTLVIIFFMNSVMYLPFTDSPYGCRVLGLEHFSSTCSVCPSAAIMPIVIK